MWAKTKEVRSARIFFLERVSNARQAPLRSMPRRSREVISKLRLLAEEGMETSWS